MLAKVLGPRKGTLVAGIMGGLVSSTAVTLSLARRTRQQPTGSHVVAAVSIIAATATLYLRILLETWVVNRDLALRMVLPIRVITVVAFAVAYLVSRKDRTETLPEVPMMNPLNFTVAVQFALA